jgi:hypothetical protein
MHYEKQGCDEYCNNDDIGDNDDYLYKLGSIKYVQPK